LRNLQAGGALVEDQEYCAENEMKRLGRLRATFAQIQDTMALAERQVMMAAQLLSARNREMSSVQNLSEVEFSAFSQWGEDGIIDWLVDNLAGVIPTFVEVGVEDYRESNTRFLLQRRNWRGVVVDSSPDHIAAIRSQEIYWRHDLTAVCSFVTRENINEILRNVGLAGEIGLLSIDIDGNDYWVWEALDVVSPAVVVCEFNAVFGDIECISVPYRSDFCRTKAHPSNLYFGASLPALIALGDKKDYRFLGTSSNGANAFFVRADMASPVLERLEEVRSYPSKFREARSPDGALLFARGQERLELIQGLEVYDFARASLTRLGSYECLYSDPWQDTVPR
jgi:hypothetical protein